MNAKIQNLARRLRRGKDGRVVKPSARAQLVHQHHFCARLLSKSPLPELVFPSAPPALRSSGWGCRVIDAAKAKNEIFAITVNEDTILGVVLVDLERGAATVVN